MHIDRFIITLFCSLWLAPTLLLAEYAILPPPTVNESNQSATSTAADTQESAPNLHESLNPPDDSAVDVRSYQRKDGSTITEYGMNGQVYKIKVQPAGDLPAYYLYRNQAGKFERRLPGGNKPIAAPSWILKEF